MYDMLSCPSIDILYDMLICPPIDILYDMLSCLPIDMIMNLSMIERSVSCDFWNRPLASGFKFHFIPFPSVRAMEK